MIVLDGLKVAQNTRLLELFTENEDILYSGELIKINKNKRKQKRNIVITTESIYNLRPDNLVTSALNIFKKGALIKRRIPIDSIRAIVYARLGNEFIIHVPEEFDYRIYHPQKDKIIEYIMYAMTKCGLPKVQVYFNDEVELFEFCTHRSEKKKGIVRPPIGETKMMTYDDFKDFVSQKHRDAREEDDNTEMLIGLKKTKITINDFELLKTLGKGGFGKVYLAQKKDTEELFALKTIRKLFVIEKKQFEQVRREKEILHEANHPFLVGLKCAFQTPDKLFFLMPFVQGGDLFMHLKKRKRFSENEVKFFTGQIILALSFLHTKSIIYQDQKPENILLESNGYIKLADFGAAKYVYQTKNYKTFIGTADYIAPEVLKKLPYNKAVDWWSLGILMYELLYGKPPFFQQNPKATFRHIQTESPKFPKDNYISQDCKDFILRLLCKDPEMRIGYTSDDELLSHPWLEEIDPEKLLNNQINAPIIPEINHETDVENFNTKYTNERPKMTLISDDLLSELKKYDLLFNGFYYDEISHLPKQKTPLGSKGELDENNLSKVSDENPNNKNSLELGLDMTKKLERRDSKGNRVSSPPLSSPLKIRYSDHGSNIGPSPKVLGNIVSVSEKPNILRKKSSFLESGNIMDSGAIAEQYVEEDICESPTKIRNKSPPISPSYARMGSGKIINNKAIEVALKDMPLNKKDGLNIHQDVIKEQYIEEEIEVSKNNKNLSPRLESPIKTKKKGNSSLNLDHEEKKDLQELILDKEIYSGRNIVKEKEEKARMEFRKSHQYLSSPVEEVSEKEENKMDEGSEHTIQK